jgi:MotA/TolQ/ExbB proton channel family
MQGLLGSLSLVGVSGYVIISAIILVVVLSMGLTLLAGSRYAGFQRELSEHTRPDRPLGERVLNRILDDAREAVSRHGRDANTQAIIEHHFQVELGGLLLSERFVRAAVGLVIILGLVGTLHGLTLSIGQLSTLVSDDGSQVADIAGAMTQGLTKSLSGMAVAFSTSFFGVASAVLLTVFGVFFNIADRRTAFMVSLEAHLDRILGHGSSAGQHGIVESDTGLQPIVAQFGDAVAGLDGAVARFETALQTFSETTRDFHEFNLHLKDNVQRMSLSFSDLSETLRAHIHALRGPGPR